MNYPTEEELEKIRTWNPEDFHGCMEYIRSLWAFDAWGFYRDGDIYHVSTGGWSGNEDILSALEENVLFWVMYWEQSRRGGHYIFAPMTFDVIKKLEQERK